VVKYIGGDFQGTEKYTFDIGSIVLAGGRGARLRHEKALETLGNKSLIQWVVFSLSFFYRDITIVTSTNQIIPRFANYPKLRIITDIYPAKGPLGGIYTGLAASDSFHNLVVACDMPFLSQSLLRYMIEGSDGFDFVIPRVNNLFEPLHAVYSKNCVAPMEFIIKQGRKVIIELFDFVKVRYVEAEEVDRFDPQHMSFFNINTQEDLERAQQLALSRKPVFS